MVHRKAKVVTVLAVVCERGITCEWDSCSFPQISITSSHILDNEPSREGFAMFSDLALRSVLLKCLHCLCCVEEETEGLVGTVICLATYTAAE